LRFILAKLSLVSSNTEAQSLIVWFQSYDIKSIALVKETNQEEFV